MTEYPRLVAMALAPGLDFCAGSISPPRHADAPGTRQQFQPVGECRAPGPIAVHEPDAFSPVLSASRSR